MAQHDWVVRKLARHLERAGESVTADHAPGFRKPQMARGPRGRWYRPDLWLERDGTAVEVEPYNALKNSLSQVKAFANDPDVRRTIVVASSGTDRGIARLQALLDRKGISAEVVNWRDLFDSMGITW